MKSKIIEPIRVVIIDNHFLIRTGIRLILERQSGLKVVGEASDKNDWLEIVASQKPDIILLRFNPLNSINIKFIQKLYKASICSRVILLAERHETQVLINAVKEGVFGIVWETQTPEILIKAIQKVHTGEVWIERSLITNLLTGQLNAQWHMNQDPMADSIAQLTQRERQVIEQIGKGLKNNLIAKQLFISESTVRHHLTAIYGKLGVSDRLELLVFAHRHDLD